MIRYITFAGDLPEPPSGVEHGLDPEHRALLTMLQELFEKRAIYTKSVFSLRVSPCLFFFAFVRSLLASALCVLFLDLGFGFTRGFPHGASN